MKIRLLLAGTLALFSATQIFADKVNLLDPDDNMVYIMSHRATTSDTSLPDNSIEGLNAVVAAGADIIEADVWRTRDGVFIVWHDDRIDGKLINDYDFETFRNHRLSNGETVPTMREYFLAGKGRVCFNIDKVEAQMNKVSQGTVPASFLSELVAEIQSYGMVEDVIFYVGNPTNAEQVLKLEPRARVGVWAQWDDRLSREYPECRYYCQTSYWPDADKEHWMQDVTPGSAACVNLLGSYCGGSEEIPRDRLVEAHVEGILKRWPNTRIIQCDVCDLMHADLERRWRRGIGYGSEIFVTPGGSGNGRGSDWENAMSALNFRELMWYRGEADHNYSNADALNGKTVRLASGEYNMNSWGWGVHMRFNPNAGAVWFAVEGGYEPGMSGRDTSRRSGRSVFVRSDETVQTSNALFWMAGKAYVTFCNCDFDGGFDNSLRPLPNGSQHAFVLGDADNTGIDSDVYLELENCTLRNFNSVALDADGGTILMRSGSAKFRDCTFCDNASANRGAALQIINYTPYPVFAMMDRCLVTRNYIDGWWGLAFHLRGGSLMMNNTTVADNHNLQPWCSYALINGSDGIYQNSGYLIVNSTLHQSSAMDMGTIRLDSSVNHFHVVNSVITNDNPAAPSVFVTSAEKGALTKSHGYNLLGVTTNFNGHELDSSDSFLLKSGHMEGDDYVYDPLSIGRYATLDDVRTAVQSFQPEFATWWGGDFYNWIEASNGFSIDRRQAPRNPLFMQPGAYDVGPDVLSGVSDVSVNGNPVVVARYDINGRRLSRPVQGINILRMSDGTVRKVIER